MIVSIVLIIAVLIGFSVRLVGPEQRGAVFRLGRFERVVGPGITFIVPTVDRLFKVDLHARVPDWQELSTERLNHLVRSIAVSSIPSHR